MLATVFYKIWYYEMKMQKNTKMSFLFGRYLHGNFSKKVFEIFTEYKSWSVSLKCASGWPFYQFFFIMILV